MACLFSEDENTVTLRPATQGQVFANSPHGTYWFPPYAEEQKIEILATLTPQREWFDIPEFEQETVTRACDEEPPAPDEETYTADWWLDWQDVWFDDARGCRASFVVEGTEIVAVEIEAPAGCDTVEQPWPSYGTLTATVTTEWNTGDRQEEGVWVPVDEQPGGDEISNERTCMMYSSLKSAVTFTFGNWETTLYSYGCTTRDPWPPEPPELETVRPTPTNEELHDLSGPPPSRVCTGIEVGDFEAFEPPPSDTEAEWWGCYSRGRPFHRSCTIAGGGQYPVILGIEKYLIWGKQLTSCSQAYVKQEIFSVNPDITTLPDSLGIVHVSEHAGEPPAG